MGNFYYSSDSDGNKKVLRLLKAFAAYKGCNNFREIVLVIGGYR